MIGRSHRSILALLIAGVASAACVGDGALPPNSESISFASRDAVFLDDLVAGGAIDPASARRITGLFRLPDRDGAAPVPAAVILHSSSGPGALESSMARALNSAGIASLVIDSFGPRGVVRTGQDQTRVTEAAIMADAFGALAFLSKDPRIRADRIAVIGFSKGAAVALYSASTELTQAITAPSEPRFAAHLAYYPWCGLNLYAPRTTGAPILIHMGENDNLVSPTQCRTLVDTIRRADSGARIDLMLYPGARHAFSHPALAYMPPLTMDAQNPGRCAIVETAPGVYRETSSNRAITHDTYRAVLADCLGHGGLVGYDSAAADLADGRTLAFLRGILLAP